MDFKLIGSILLIVGTSIGAGMLALPIATAELGFLPAVLLLILCWAVMIASALLFLEINLWLPQNSHLVSMAKATLGGYGELLTWGVYLLLLYSLLCAYISGGSDFLNSLFLLIFKKKVASWISVWSVILILGGVVYGGMRVVDYVNRHLMILKLGLFCFLILLLSPWITVHHLMPHHVLGMGSPIAMTVALTAFGFAPIIPSLRVYFASHLIKLKIAIWIGSLIPLLCYIAWNMVIMGILPQTGAHGLETILLHNESADQLAQHIALLTTNPTLAFMMQLFSPICIVTSFLGVALCLSDFLSDGLKLEKCGANQCLIYGLTFLPPASIVLFWPHIFIKALRYAGIYSVILLIILPTLMVWRGRGRYHPVVYQAPIGKLTLASLLLFSGTVIANSFIT